MSQLTFDAEHRADQEERLRQMRQQLEEAEYRRSRSGGNGSASGWLATGTASSTRRCRAGMPSRCSRCCPSASRCSSPRRRPLSSGNHSWWGDLRHGGMLIAPALLEELYPELPELDRRSYDKLRSAWLAAEGARPADAQERDAPSSRACSKGRSAFAAGRRRERSRTSSRPRRSPATGSGRPGRFPDGRRSVGRSPVRRGRTGSASVAASALTPASSS